MLILEIAYLWMITYNNINIISRSNGVTDNYFPNSVYFTPQFRSDTSYFSSFSFVFEQPGVYSMNINGYTDEDLFYGGEKYSGQDHYKKSV